SISLRRGGAGAFPSCLSCSSLGTRAGGKRYTTPAPPLRFFSLFRACPRGAFPFLLPMARSPWPRIVGGAIGVLGLATIIVAGLFGSTDATRNPTEYLTWIYFWAGTVILSGLVGNLWYLLNPWAAIYDVVARLFTSPPRGEVGRRAG